MKYFKPEIWLDLQTLDSMNDAEMQWELNAQNYLTQLEGLRPKLSQRNYEFFRFSSLHDGYIVNLSIQNKNSQEMKAKGKYIGTKHQKRPIIVNLEVLSGNYIYYLKFRKVTVISIDSPKDDMLPGSSGLGDWGYDELTEIDSDTLRYEVLFSSGSILLIEFSGFSYARKRFIK